MTKKLKRLIKELNRATDPRDIRELNKLIELML